MTTIREPRPALKIGAWSVIVAIVVAAVCATTPPRALDVTAPAEQFSAARAKLHVEQIAREPHPIGTAANARVRDYLIEQLRSLGGEVEVLSTVGITDGRRQIYAGTADNVFATFKGAANSRAVMLTSHYDSVPEAPGAADAGAGVAAILETIRASQSSGPVRNDLLVLFTDGEEEGLIGAAGFVRDHPEIVERVGVVMNFEARGSSGPALMFETSDNNGWLTREFARAAPYPFSSSLAYAVYKNLPNQTDMTVFKKAGLTGLNFAFNATFENYHTRRDTPENLDPRSLQNLGANALGLTRHFGNLELSKISAPDRVYFNWIGSRIIDYAQWIVWPLLTTAMVMLIAALVVARRLGGLTISRALGGVGGLFIVLLAALAGAHLVYWAVGISTERLLVGDTLSNKLLAVACLAAGLACCLAVQSWLAARLQHSNSAAGQLIAFTLLASALTWWMPTASYLLQWPLLFALAGFGASMLLKRSLLAALLGSLPTLLIFPPLMYLLFVTLGFDTIAVSVLALLLALAVTVLSPLLPRISRPLKVSVPVCLMFAATLAIAGRQLSRFSPEHPRRNSLFYSVNADEQKAAWISYDAAPDEWARQFLTAAPVRGKAPAFTVGSSRETLSHPAEWQALAAPAATVISNTVANGERLLKLRLTPARAANTLLMRFPADVPIVSVTIEGRSHLIADRGGSAPWFLRYNAPPPGGVEVELRLTTAAPFTCWLGDRVYGLPEMPGQTFQPRPRSMMPTYGSDVSLTTRQYKF